MNGATSSHIPALVTAITGFLVAASALIGVLLNRRRQPAEVNLITAQAGLAEETREKTRAEVRKLDAERESLAVGTLEKALLVSARRVEQLEADVVMWKEHAGAMEAERDQAREQFNLMVEQSEKVKAVLKANNLEYPS